MSYAAHVYTHMYKLTNTGKALDFHACKVYTI